MANPDPYLRPGLPANNDVELYESAATGGSGTTYTVSVSATAIGAAGVATQSILSRSFVATGSGVATAVATTSRSVAVSATAVASASMERTAELARAFTAEATGTASVAMAATHFVSVSATSTGSADVALSESLARTFSATATGTASVSFSTGVTHAVSVQATATGVASVSLTPTTPTVIPVGGRWWMPPATVVHRVKVRAVARGRARVTYSVHRDMAVRRRAMEDELVLVGVL